MSDHSHKHHKDVLKILKNIARINNQTPQNVIQEFTTGDGKYVIEFWTSVSEKYSDKYNEVYRCPGCKKFDLEYVEDVEKISEFLPKLKKDVIVH